MLDRLERLGEAGEYFFVVGDGLQLEECFPKAARYVKSLGLNFSLKSKGSAYRLITELRKTGMIHVVILYDEAKDEHVTLLFEAVPGLTVHHLREHSYTGKGISKRNISSNGEALPDGVNLLAEVFFMVKRQTSHAN